MHYKKTYGGTTLPRPDSESVAYTANVENGDACKRLPNVLDMTRALISQGWPAVGAFAEASARVRFMEKFNAEGWK